MFVIKKHSYVDSFRIVTFFKFILVCLLSPRAKADTKQDFIIDYFKYTRVASVVGFTCNNEIDDSLLIKGLNEIGVTSVLFKFNDQLSIATLAFTSRVKIGIFLDANCYEAEDNIVLLLQEASTYWMFDALRYWLILGSDYEAVLNITDDRSFGLSTDFKIGISVTDMITYQLYDAYNVFKSRGTKLNVTLHGSWSKDSGIDISVKQEKFFRRKHLHGITLLAAYFKTAFKPIEMDFENYLLDSKFPTRDGLSKYGCIILKLLADMYNFSLKSYETEMWTKGDRLGPVARALTEGKADFTGSPININAMRLKLMKYVHQSWPFRTCFIFRNPQPTAIKFKEILRPLANEIWVFSVIFSFVNITVLYMVMNYEKVEKSITKLSNSVLLTVGALCQQGTNIEMFEIPTRIAFISIMIFSLLIYNYYSAIVVSARLAEPIVKINDSLSELGKLQLKMASEMMPYLEFFLKQPDWETKTFYQKYWLLLPESTWYMDPEIGMRLVQKGGFAYHFHPNVGYPLIEKLYENHEICELMEVHVARPTFVTFGVHFNSTITEVARVGLIRVSEVGLRRRLLLIYQYRKPKCRPDVLTATSINIYEFAPHLILLSIGTIAAMIVFIFESIIHYYNNLEPRTGKSFMKLVPKKFCRNFRNNIDFLA